MTQATHSPEETYSLTFERHLAAPPERVFKAFIDPAAIVKWNPPHGFIGKVQEWNAEEGGSWHMSFTNLGTGTEHGFGGIFAELQPGRRIVWTDAFDDPDAAQGMRTTIEFAPSSAGTFLTITQEGIQGMPREFPLMGWQESLRLLELLVTPDIPDGPTD